MGGVQPSSGVFSDTDSGEHEHTVTAEEVAELEEYINARGYVMSQEKYDELHPVLPVYKQDMMIADPSGTVLVDRDRVPRRRKKAWPHEEVLKPPEGAADPEGFRDDRVTENIPMLISNDPTQYPYRGTFCPRLTRSGRRDRR